LPNTTPPLDPFKSYSIYMVLRDRSGNLSEIETRHVIDDQTPPKIDNTSIKIAKDDKNATFKFMSNEEGTYHYILRKAGDTTVSVPTSAEEVIDRGHASTMRKDTNEISLALEPHQDYELYVAVKDRYKNATMLQVGTESKVYTYDEKQNKTVALTSGVSGTGIMAYKFFSDGTPPKVEDPIVKQLDGKTFEVTFSEAVELTASDFQLVDPETSSAITPTYASWKWQDKVDEIDGWKPRKMIITFANEITQSFDMTVDASVIDKGGWSFSKLTSSFIYRTLTTNIESAKLQPPIATDRSKNIIATFDFTFADPSVVPGEEAKFYYKAYSNTYSQAQINAVKPVEVIIPDTPGALVSLSSGNGQTKLSDGRTEQSITHSTVSFIEGDYIVIVIVDKYGNMYKVQDIITK